MSLAPPVEKDGFAYVGDAFYTVSSNQNSHRRATAPELKELFQPTPGTTSTAKDPPAHWYEAQLIHYGLNPSKTKAVARERLLSAYTAGPLAVPQHLQKMEAELKKEWNKQSKQAKKIGKETESNVPQPKAAARKPAKKKAEAMPSSNKTEGAKQATKKRKPDGTDLASTAPSSKKKKTAVEMKVQIEAPVTMEEDEDEDYPIHTARSSNPLNYGTRFNARPSPVAASGPPISAARTGRSKQTARKSAPFNPRSWFNERDSALAQPEDGDDDVRYSTEDGDGDNVPHDDRASHHRPSSSLSDPVSGSYWVETSVDGSWSMFEDHESLITVVPHGREVWGTYDFGMFEGVFKISERTQGGEYDFRWRGIENSESMISYDDRHQTGKMSFDTDGRISGTFRGLYGDVTFEGDHDGDGSSGHAAAYERLKRTWDSYSQQAYRAAEVGRWR